MKAFSKLGNKVFVIIIRSEHKTPRISYFQENELDVIEIHPPSFMKLKGTRGIGRYLNYLACFPTIFKVANNLIKKHGIDYVYSYMPGIGSSLPAVMVKSKHKIKFMLDFADLHVFVRPKKIADSAFKKADKIIVITEYLRQELARRSIDIKKVSVIPNGVDLDIFNPTRFSKEEIANIRQSFGGDKLVVFSGSLQDLNIIINSASDVIKKIPEVKYIIIGDHRDPTRSRSVWEQKAKSKGLEKHFEFLGRKPREEIPKYILCADVCVDSFPDEPYYAAAHPVKLLEYGACGRPILATRVTETENLIKHNEFGMLAHPGNTTEFANYLIELLGSPDHAKKMSTEFSNYVKENFGWDKIAKDLYSVFESNCQP